MDTQATSIGNFAKKASSIQEQLPRSLKAGGDTRPWTGLHARHSALAASFSTLVALLTEKNRLDLVTDFNTRLNAELVEFLANFEGFFREMQSATKTTIQLVAPGYYVLAQFCDSKTTDSEAIIILKNAVLAGLDNKYWSSIKALHWVATFLDPTLKSFSFVPEKTAADRDFKLTLQRDVITWTIDYMKHTEDKHNEEDDCTAPKVTRTSSSVFTAFRQSQFQESSSMTGREELEAYRIKTFRTANDNPLEFWKANQKEFPNISRVAKEIFAAQASSAQSERDFSKAGLIRTARRSLLSADQICAVEMISSAMDAKLFTF